MLKILAGVIPLTQGRVLLEGKVFAMIDLNAGLQPEFTGRENVWLLGMIMGFTRKFMRKKMQAIEDFCELGQYFDKPVQTYSQGMLVRLGFAAAVNVKAEILLVDETMAAGDLKFQNRCLRRIKQLKEEQGASVIFVSHDLDMVQYLCDRTALLYRGKLIKVGPSAQVITEYENHIHRLEFETRLPGKAYLSGGVSLESAQVFDYDGKATLKVNKNKGFLVNFRGKTVQAIERPIFTFAIQNTKNEHVLFEIFPCNLSAEPLLGPFSLTVSVPPLPLSAGHYTINFSLRDQAGYLTHARYHYVASFLITAEKRERGLLAVPLAWKIKTDFGEFTGTV